MGGGGEMLSCTPLIQISIFINRTVAVIRTVLDKVKGLFLS